MSLKEYKEKRDFKKTNEPKGTLQKTQTNRFVVQLHKARAKHYDFRLEFDGVLVSFAVPKGLSNKPKEKRLAVKVEDHPVDYINFEGIIPKGNYGAGTVQIFDKGNYVALDDMKKGLKDGHIKVVLNGEKLKGEYGALQVFTDAHGNDIIDLTSLYAKAESGCDIYLTIDLEIQEIIENTINNAIKQYDPDQMLILVQSPKTGEILGMASYPNFYPENYQDYSQEIYNRNLPIWMSYEPGSTFKIVTYSAGLEEQVFTLDEGFFCPGYRMVAGARIKDWKAGGHGSENRGLC